jgi:signal recognition particle subunit SRP68
LFRYARLLLLTAERAWAHAMYMKTSQTEDSASQKFPGATRSHIVSRLVKASKQAMMLLSLLHQISSKATEIDVLEAQAYAYYLSGSAEFERLSASPKLADAAEQREKWRECLEAFSVARLSYSTLFKKTKSDCFKDILTNEVDPGIRVAAYQSQIPRTVAITEVARRCFPQDEGALVESLVTVDESALKAEGTGDGDDQNFPKSIQWRSRSAKIVDASIGQALYAVSQAEAKLGEFLATRPESLSAKLKAAAYDDILIASQDAVDTTRHVIEELERDKVPESDARMQDLRVTNLAVNYDMIGWRVGRNRVLIGENDGLALEEAPLKRRKRNDNNHAMLREGRGRKLVRLRERIALYDAILQSIDSVKDIRGAVRDSGFVEELDSHRAYYQALK